MADFKPKIGSTDDIAETSFSDGQMLVGHKDGKISLAVDFTEDNQNKRATLELPTVELTITQLTASNWANGRYSFESIYP